MWADSYGRVVRPQPGRRSRACGVQRRSTNRPSRQRYHAAAQAHSSAVTAILPPRRGRVILSRDEPTTVFSAFGARDDRSWGGALGQTSTRWVVAYLRSSTSTWKEPCCHRQNRRRFERFRCEFSMVRFLTRRAMAALRSVVLSIATCWSCRVRFSVMSARCSHLVELFPLLSLRMALFPISAAMNKTRC